MIGAVAATGGDLVFASEITGDFLVFDANDGKVLYKHNVGGPIAGGVVSYASGGRRYVRRGPGIRGRLLQPDGARDRWRKPHHHCLRAETVMLTGVTRNVWGTAALQLKSGGSAETARPDSNAIESRDDAAILQ
jgi:hypothetical protein